MEFGDDLNELRLVNEGNKNVLLENLQIDSNTPSDCAFDCNNTIAKETGVMTEVKKLTHNTKEVELIRNEIGDVIKPGRDNCYDNRISANETQIHGGDDSSHTSSLGNSTDDESDSSDSSIELSGIDFDNDKCNDNEENDAQMKPASKDNLTEMKQKSGDLGIPQVDFRLLKLRDLSSIEVPKDTSFKLAGTFMHIMDYDRSVMIESAEGVPTLNLGTILFRKNGEPLGEVCDIIGNVRKPCYSLNFKTLEEIQNKKLERGESIFYAPLNLDLTFLVRQEDVITYGTDASGIGDVEASDEDFSDDEKESKCKSKNTNQKGAKSASIAWPEERRRVRACRKGAKISQALRGFESPRTQIQPLTGMFPAPPPMPTYPSALIPPPPLYPPSPIGYPYTPAPVPAPLTPYFSPPAPHLTYSYPPPPMPNWPSHHVPPMPQQWPPPNSQQWPHQANPYHPIHGRHAPGSFYR